MNVEMLIEYIKNRNHWEYGDIKRLAELYDWNYRQMRKLVQKYRRYETRGTETTCNTPQAVKDRFLYEQIVQEYRKKGLM